MRVLYINFRNPNFRVKGKGRNYLSVEGEELKRAVRGLYKNFLSDYHHDIIMHIGDNYYQNVHIRQLFEAKIDLTDFFKSIFNLEYVVLKNDVPYTPSEFPQEAPITKDIDILCSAEDYPKLVESVLNFIGRFKFTYSVIEKEVHEYHKRFNLELNSVLILQFDVFAIDSSFTTSFLKSTLAGRRLCKNLFFIPRLEDELSYRLVEYYKTPSKKHHLEFLINNKDYLDLERVRSQVTFDINSKGFRFAPLIFEVIALLWKAEILIL